MGAVCGGSGALLSPSLDDLLYRTTKFVGKKIVLESGTSNVTRRFRRAAQILVPRDSQIGRAGRQVRGINKAGRILRILGGGGIEIFVGSGFLVSFCCRFDRLPNHVKCLTHFIHFVRSKYS